MEVIGIKYLNFKAKDGNIIKGVKLFVTDDSIPVDAGVACDTVFLSDSMLAKYELRPDDIHVGYQLGISYNKFGKIQCVAIL